MAIIKTENLTYVYGEKTPFRHVALDSVNIEINEGEIVGVIGHTGSGKSTLIQHFNGLLKPTSGRVLVDGEDFSKDKKKLREVRFKVGLVFQYPEYQLFEETVAKDIAYGPKNMGLDKDEIERRVIDSARLVGLTKEQLDSSPRGREQIFGMIKQYHEERGGTVLIVSHSMEDIARYADRILVMNEGRVFCFDKTSEVFRRSTELEQIGLAVPQITRIIGRLNAMGCGLPEDVYTVKYAEGLIAAKLGQTGV